MRPDVQQAGRLASGSLASYPADAPVITRCSRVSGTPTTLGLFPAGTLAEEIDTPGDGRTRGLITVAANPVLSAPGSGRLERALPTIG
jgi:hypothetical protein